MLTGHRITRPVLTHYPINSLHHFLRRTCYYRRLYDGCRSLRHRRLLISATDNSISISVVTAPDSIVDCLSRTKTSRSWRPQRIPRASTTTSP
ncbi:hypothetical protein FPSE5266_20172 [Fusarium pseudograminearum]|nr:hypothetical protein FPSE5266_20172 [Fusarium pseudograminearum]